MVANRLGPEVRGTTIRPAPTVPTATDTWFKDCVGGDPSTGTALEQDWHNKQLAVERSLFDQVGITAVDDNILRDAIALQSQQGVHSFAIDSGTADALVITLAPVPTSVPPKDGERIWVQKGATANATTAPTIARNGGPAIVIVAYDGTALQVGDLPASGRLHLTYRVATNRWYLMGATANRGGFSTGFSAFTSGSGNFVVPAGIFKIDVELWGAGAGGGGAQLSGAAGGGGSGAYARAIMSVTPGASLAYVIGTGGTAGTGSGTNGVGGGVSTFNGISCPGGIGGQGAIAAADANPSGATAAPTGGQLNIAGVTSGCGIAGQDGNGSGAVFRCYGGPGGNAPRGGSGGGSYIGDGQAGSLPGGGGGGGGSYYFTGGHGNGGAGANGTLLVRW